MNEKSESVRERYLRAFGKKDGANVYRIYEDLYFTSTIWQRWQVFYSKERNNLDLINSVAPDFFMVLQRMMFERIVTSLLRISERPKDGSNRNGTIEYYAELAKSKMSEEERELFNNSLDRFREELQPFKKWRDKHYAHFDYDQLIKQADVSLNALHLEKLLSLAAETYNTIERAYFNASIQFKYSTRQLKDAEHLIHLLKLGLEQHRTQFDDKPKS